MKKIFLILPVLFLIMAFVINKPSPSITVYYVSASGNDITNSGTSSSSPWKTLQKINVSVFNAGDSIVLNRGDVFYGSLIVNRNDLKFGDYGNMSLSNPKITGFTNIAKMVPSGTNNIYSAVIPNAKKTLNIVSLDGDVKTSSREPDVTEANQGWLMFTASIDSARFRGATTVNHIGKGVIVKSETYKMFKGIVSAQNHDTLSYARAEAMTSGGSIIRNQSVPTSGGRGYFFTNDSSYIDEEGEYHLDLATKRLRMKLTGGLASRSLNVATLDTGINIGSRLRISISNIDVEGFNLYGVFVESVSNFTMQGCKISKVSRGLNLMSAQNGKVLGCDFTDCLEGGIQSKSSTKDSLTITGCNFLRIGLIDGQGSFYQDDYVAISANVRSYLYVGYNTVSKSGHNGISTSCLRNSLVENNIVDSADMRLSDNAGIYSWRGAGDTNIVYNRVWKNNFVSNSIGNFYGTNTSTQNLGSGIYLDGSAKNDSVLNNTIWNIPRWGIEINDGHGIVGSNNTIYNVLTSDIYSSKLFAPPASVKLQGNICYKFDNNVYPDTRRYHFYYVDINMNGFTMQQSITASLTMGGNYYNKATVANFKLDGIQGSTAGSFPFNNLAAWKTYSGQDLSSIALPDYGMDKAILFRNTSGKIATYYVPFKAKTVTGVPYQEGFTLAPYTSLLLIYDSDLVPVEGIRIKLRVRTN